MKFPVLFVACLLPTWSYADTPQSIQDHYVASAGAGFVASAARGERFFQQRFALSDVMPSCASCHTTQPVKAGEHVVTGKTIKPLAVSANADRFSRLDKTEKWFDRNCKEVVGRLCSPAEKADFVAWLREVR